MIPLIDFQKRSLNGPVMKTDEFDLSLSMKVRELVDKYSIKYNPEELIIDDNTADGVFNAGVDLLADIGLYHLGTQRVVKYSKDEILQFVNERKQNPGKAILGSGDDEIIIEYRAGKDSRPPVMYAGAAGVITEEEFLPLMISFAREKTIKGMGIAGGIDKVNGIEPKAGTLSEIHCAKWEQRKLKEALEKTGRPGLCLGLLCTASTVGATMQCVDGEFRNSRNTHIGVHVIPEQKIDWDRLILAGFCEERGIVPWQSSMSLIGGLCRNAADAAVCMTANVLGHMSYANGPMCSVFPTHLDGTWATRATMWSVGAVMRASERNIRLAMGSGVVGSYEWGRTKAGVLQEAVKALLYTANGLSYAWLAGSPVEAIVIDNLMKKATTMDHGNINAIANDVLEKIDELKKTEQPRKTISTFRDYYDIKTIEPLPELMEAIDHAKNVLAKAGVAV